MSDFLGDDTAALAERIPDGSRLALIHEGGGAAMTVTRALIRRQARNLRVVNVPTGGMQTDMLIGAGCVETVETSGVSLGEFGQAPNFGAAVKSGAVTVMDATCPAIYAALQAGEKGIPFIPFRGLIGSDLLRFRPDWKVIDNPFGQNDPIVLLPALRPDVALFHAPKADRQGNVWVGRCAEARIMAHAALATLVTVEELVDDNLMEDPALAPATLSSLYVDAFAVAPRGAAPLALPGIYDGDADRLAHYAECARDHRRFREYIERDVSGQHAEAG